VKIHSQGKFNVMKKYLRKLTLFAGVSAILIGFSGCFTTGYVTTEPAYVQYSRPAQPSTSHIWVGDGWGYNRSSRAYVQKNGYWKKPIVKSRTYQSGQWKSTPKGHSWKSGKWQKNHR
jgi:hypothetical protein